jgi:hypothetical protein
MVDFEVTLFSHSTGRFSEIIKCYSQSGAISIMQKKWPQFTIVGIKELK